MDSLQLTGRSDHHIHWYSKNIGIHHKVVEPWNNMVKAARKAGFNLAIASGYRSFERQLSIWNRKYSGELTVKDVDNQLLDITKLSPQQQLEAILTYSALPGTSRHHWGTDLDFYDPSCLDEDQSLQLEPWEYIDSGPFSLLTAWLFENAQEFGFYFPYDKYRGGVACEPWHLSYFPLAHLYEQELTSEMVNECIMLSDMLGQKEVIKQVELILTQFVFNIGRPSNG